MDGNAIRNRLSAIEQENSVRILLASESGSRAWGFASPNSDYDVRGIYVRSVEWYLSINVENKRDVIEVSEGELDIALWDLRKALKLGAKSNPALFEWFVSPHVYIDTAESHYISAQLAPFYSPRRAAYHYRQMAKNNFDRYLQGNRVKLKKFLYVVRPILVLHWLSEIHFSHDSIVPPILFSVLFDESVRRGNIRDNVAYEIVKLVERKCAGDELGESGQNWILYDYLNSELIRLETLPYKLPDSDARPEWLNDTFLHVIYDKVV